MQASVQSEIIAKAKLEIIKKLTSQQQMVKLAQEVIQHNTNMYVLTQALRIGFHSLN